MLMNDLKTAGDGKNWYHVLVEIKPNSQFRSCNIFREIGLSEKCLLP